MKKNILLISLTCLFVLLLTATAYVSFSGNIETQELTVKSITPIYDETSGVIVTQDKVTFNDKNQVVYYKVVIENTQNYDVKINNISLTTPTEEFLSFEVEDIQENDVVKANGTKEINISFETMGIEGWGRNFSDELTANISFEKVTKQEEVAPPKEDENTKEEEQPKEEEVPKEEEPSKPNEGEESSKPEPQPEAPIKDEKELIKNVEKIEEVVFTTNTIELPKEIKVSVGEKLAVWIYSEPIFLGYFDVVVENGVKKIEGLEEALAKTDIKAGDHNIVLVSNKETIGYIPVSINENKELITEDNKRDESIENPYTSDNKLLFLLIIATGTTGLAIVIVSQNKVTKYMIFAIVLGSTLIPTNAEGSIELPITFNVNFESQNVMKPSGCSSGFNTDGCKDFWEHSWKIVNFNIVNEKNEIEEYDYKFDVTEAQNKRIQAYLIKNESKTTCYNMEGVSDKCYDLYLQSDGIIYANENASYYFSYMINLENISNLVGFDTSKVTNMSYMFSMTGFNSKNFKLDLRNFKTSKVTNMNSMFMQTAYQNKEFELNISTFDTSNVTDMSAMFYWTGYNSAKFTLDLSNFDTSKVTDMSAMFYWTGYNNSEFTLDVSSFDTSKVINMNSMFYGTGYNSRSITLDINRFNTSNVTDMEYMFFEAGYSNPDFELNVSNFDTSKVTNMSYMFGSTGYKSTKFTLNVSDFDTSKVTNMSYMFYEAGKSSDVFQIDVSNFDTTEVTNMNSMFYSAGYKNKNFELDVSNFDTSKVTDMSYMLFGTGYNSIKLNTSITIRNSTLNKYTSIFNYLAVNTGTIFKVNYTKETEAIVDKMINTKSYGANVIKGNMAVDVDNLSTGDEIHISGEKFNVISQTDDTVTMLAQYNLGNDYKQSKDDNGVHFSDNVGWENKPGSEIDIQVWSTNPKTYINAYIDYLKEQLSNNVITGDLIKLSELGKLGCKIPYDYAPGSYEWICTNSDYSEWLVNGQDTWTSSASSEYAYTIWILNEDGEVYDDYHSTGIRGIRPTITISKEALRNYK